MVHIDHFGPKEVEIELGRYENGRLAVQLVENGDDYATVSVNFPFEVIGPDEFAFKTYSENEGLYEELIRSGEIESTGRQTNTMGLPICRIRT